MHDSCPRIRGRQKGDAGLTRYFDNRGWMPTLVAFGEHPMMRCGNISGRNMTRAQLRSPDGAAVNLVSARGFTRCLTTKNMYAQYIDTHTIFDIRFRSGRHQRHGPTSHATRSSGSAPLCMAEKISPQSMRRVETAFSTRYSLLLFESP